MGGTDSCLMIYNLILQACLGRRHKWKRRTRGEERAVNFSSLLAIFSLQFSRVSGLLSRSSSCRQIAPRCLNILKRLLNFQRGIRGLFCGYTSGSFSWSVLEGVELEVLEPAVLSIVPSFSRQKIVNVTSGKISFVIS